MNDPTINLTHLRAIAVACTKEYPEITCLPAEVVLALINTAEAAHHWWIEGIETQEPFDHDLAETLNRFDFTPEDKP